MPTLKPILGCSLSCRGCYESEIFRANGNKPDPYDLDAVINKMLAIPGPVTLHGGEILLMPVPDLRQIMEAARKDNRRLSLQTSASILTSTHIDLFKEFKVGVGVSLNGPAELNRDRTPIPHTSRQLPVLEMNNVTDKMTERIHRNLELMHEAGIGVSVICVLSRTNAGTPELVTRLIEWAHDLGERLNIWSLRFNPLHDDYTDGAGIELTEQEAADAYLVLAEATLSDKRRMWLPFREFVDNIWGLGCQPCWVGSCDPFSTAAVHAVFGDGSEGNCLRTAKDGIAYLRDSQTYDWRGTILKQTPIEDGGCEGCKHWRVCKGACPAEAIDGDWRNRSRFCQIYYQTYDYLIEKTQGMIPNFTPVQSWTTNSEQEMLQGISNRQPSISAINPMRPEWSQTPSSWRQDARSQK